MLRLDITVFSWSNQRGNCSEVWVLANVTVQAGGTAMIGKQDVAILPLRRVGCRFQTEVEWKGGQNLTLPEKESNVVLTRLREQYEMAQTLEEGSAV